MGKRFFSSSQRPDRLWVKWVPGSFAWVKSAERDVDHSPLSSADVKSEWSYPSLPSICLHGVVGDNFAFSANRRKSHASGDVI
jgi:hypothetical protein